MRKATFFLVVATVLGGFCVRPRVAMSAGTIETTGTGFADPNIPNITQRRAGARDAAIVQARYKMLSIVRGSTPRFSGSPDTVKINEAVKGAQVVRTKWADDGDCTVTLRLDRSLLP